MLIRGCRPLGSGICYPELKKRKTKMVSVIKKQPKTPLTAAPSAENTLVQEIEKTLWRDKWLSVPIFAGLVLAAVISGFLWIYHGSLAPVYVANLRVSAHQNQTDLQSKLIASTSDYKLSIQDENGHTAKYPLAKVGMSVDIKKSAQAAKAQFTGGALARLQWWQPIKVDLVVNTNKDALDNFLHQSVIKLDQPYQNASLSADNGQAVITADSTGKGWDLANPYYDVPEAVANLSTKPLKLQKMTIPPAIKRSELNDELAKLQNILNQKIVLNVGSGSSVTATPADIASWLDLNPVEHAKTVDISVNSGRVLDYLNKIAKPYIQPPRSRLVQTQTDGSVTVLDPGTNGIDIVNKDKTAGDIAKLVLAGRGVNQNLDIDYAAAKTVEVQPYDRWIVVDTTAKRMYAYEKSTLVHSFLVSAGAPATPTVLGQYAIYSKIRIQDMQGANADGSRYYQPNVEWVNYFYADYAIHGNYWRPLSYFGNVNSSHGCVGVVNSDAQWIYDWAPIGTPVIVHD